MLSKSQVAHIALYHQSFKTQFLLSQFKIRWNNAVTITRTVTGVLHLVPSLCVLVCRLLLWVNMVNSVPPNGSLTNKLLASSYRLWWFRYVTKAAGRYEPRFYKSTSSIFFKLKMSFDFVKRKSQLTFFFNIYPILHYCMWKHCKIMTEVDLQIRAEIFRIPN